MHVVYGNNRRLFIKQIGLNELYGKKVNVLIVKWWYLLLSLASLIDLLL